jgi:hypothetical protein
MRRTAERAVFIASLSDIPDHMAELCPSSASTHAESLRAFSLLGLSYSTSMLNAVHRGPGSRVPSGRALRVWESAALTLLPTIEATDPDWIARWPGPTRNRVTSDIY